MRPSTPRGFKDVLPQEAAERETITSAISDTMSSWGYGPVETPVFEEYATLEAGVGGSLEGTAFRLFDSDGRLLALRPEMTVPIARLAATRLGDEPLPLRLRYVSDVFREQASMRGQSRQFAQVGLELIGAEGPEADAEVIGVLVESLSAAGLESFTVGVGTVSVLHSLIGSAGMEPEWSTAVLDAAHERNLVAIDELAGVAGLSEQTSRALRAVPRIRGGREAIDACREIAGSCGAGPALDDMTETWSLLETLGLTDRVSVDFGIMRSFDYYTGIVLEVYAPGLGLPLGGGGRYDGVMAEFEAPAPAAGFAIGIERLQIALAEQSTAVMGASLDVVLGGEAANAFLEASRLRTAGLSVRLSELEGADLVAEACHFDAIAAIARNDEVLRLDSGGAVVGPLLAAESTEGREPS